MIVVMLLLGYFQTDHTSRVGMGGWGGGMATCETEFSTLSHYSIFRTVITTQVPFETEA